ncbi:MAG TPA: hypothetical protein VJZ72_04900, partial [Candidatus Limnocylindrales bacterium]|nr:hypothetical protein [Candidatus Limnocylindrales bacterium]
MTTSRRSWTTDAADLARPFLVTVVGLGLTTLVVWGISPSEPGEYTLGWLLSPFIGLVAFAEVGYVAGRVAPSTWPGLAAVASGVAALVGLFLIVFGGPDLGPYPEWAGAIGL